MITHTYRLLTLSALTLLCSGALFAAADDRSQLPAAGVMLDPNNNDAVLTAPHEGALLIKPDGSLLMFGGFITKNTIENIPIWFLKSEPRNKIGGHQEDAEEKYQNQKRALKALARHVNS
jgi:hypothetical protein